MNLNNPSLIIRLPKELKEISGLTALANNQLAAVQDEKGILFIIDLPSGEITKRIKFNRKGDYEGLCSLDDVIFITDSAGNLTELNLSTEETTSYSTELNHKNNVEGLCVHPNGESLLFALKGQSDLDGNNKNYSSIFEYNLNRQKIEKDPFIKVFTKDIERLFNVKMNQPFSPSGICYWEDQYYILSHKCCAIAIYSDDKQLKDYIELDRKLFAQPEGININDDILYICNEGKKNTATILGFNIK